jgi:hypothetical protein
MTGTPVLEELRFRRLDLYVCRPLNGKHKITILCVLSGSAVKSAFKFQYLFLTNFNCIRRLTWSLLRN